MGERPLARPAPHRIARGPRRIPGRPEVFFSASLILEKKTPSGLGARDRPRGPGRGGRCRGGGAELERAGETGAGRRARGGPAPSIAQDRVAFLPRPAQDRVAGGARAGGDLAASRPGPGAAVGVAAPVAPRWMWSFREAPAMALRSGLAVGLGLVTRF